MDQKDADQKQQSNREPSPEQKPTQAAEKTPDKSAPPNSNRSGQQQPSGQSGSGKSRRSRGGRGGGQQKQAANQKPSAPQPDRSQGAQAGDANKARSTADQPGAASRKHTLASAQQKNPQKPAQEKAADVSESTAEKAQSAPAGAPTGSKQSTNTNKTAATKAPRSRDGEPKASSAAVGVLGIWLVLVFLLLAGSLGGASWYGWQLLEENHDRISGLENDFTQQHQDLNQQAEQIAQAHESLLERDAKIENQISDLQQSLSSQRDEIDSALDARSGEVETRIDHLATNVQRIEDRLSRGEVAWKTAEIGFLLTRAQERLVIARDPAGAAVALDLADQRIAQLARPHWLGLRDKIATAVGEIESARSFDRIGAALSMRRLGDHIDQWPLVAESVIEQAAPETNELTEPSRPSIDASLPWYERSAKHAWRWVTDQFHVEQQSRQIEPASRFETDREMRIWLTAVREALLARDVPNLERALHEAEYWLDEHYNLDDAGPSRLAEQLADIRSSAGLSEYPDLEELFTAWEAAEMRERENARRYDGEGE